MKAEEQTFSQWNDLDFFFLPSSASSFLPSMLICFDNSAVNALRLVGDRLTVRQKSKRGKCCYSSGSQLFCKKWIYTVHKVLHKGPDVPIG